MMYLRYMIFINESIIRFAKVKFEINSTGIQKILYVL